MTKNIVNTTIAISLILVMIITRLEFKLLMNLALQTHKPQLFQWYFLTKQKPSSRVCVPITGFSFRPSMLVASTVPRYMTLATLDKIEWQMSSSTGGECTWWHNTPPTLSNCTVCHHSHTVLPMLVTPLSHAEEDKCPEGCISCRLKLIKITWNSSVLSLKWKVAQAKEIECWKLDIAGEIWHRLCVVFTRSTIK